MIQRFKLKVLDKKVTSAVSFVVKIVNKLETINNQYLTLQKKAATEAEELIQHSKELEAKSIETNKLLENFKKLLTE